jgi:hypothetical protein
LRACRGLPSLPRPDHSAAYRLRSLNGGRARYVRQALLCYKAATECGNWVEVHPTNDVTMRTQVCQSWCHAASLVPGSKRWRLEYENAHEVWRVRVVVIRATGGCSDEQHKTATIASDSPDPQPAHNDQHGLSPTEDRLNGA